MGAEAPGFFGGSPSACAGRRPRPAPDDQPQASKQADRSRRPWAAEAGIDLGGFGRCRPQVPADAGNAVRGSTERPAESCNGAGRRSGTSPPGASLGSIFRGPSAFGRIGILVHLKRECQRLVVLPDRGSPLSQFSIVPVEATHTRGRIGSALGKLILIGAKIVAEDGGQSSDDAP